MSVCIQNIWNTISFILQNIFISAKNLAKIVGQLISTKYMRGNITSLKKVVPFGIKNLT